MKPTQLELTNWALSQIETKYKNDVALLIGIFGHALDNDCHGECFDYFIPVNENGNQLAQTFIIDGVGHDLYPRSWKRIENMANLDDNFTNGLADGVILYARNEDDRQQFIAMQEKLKANLQNKDFMLKKALEKLDNAMEIYRTMMFEESLYQVRMAAGFIAKYLSFAVAHMNGTYFKQRLELETVELAQMTLLPEHFIAYYEGIVKASTVDALKQHSYDMIRATRAFIAAHKPPVSAKAATPDYKELAGWYEEGSLTFRRISIHCDAQNYERVFTDAISIQHELNIIKEEFGLSEMDLIGSFDFQNLNAIKHATQKIEQYIISEIERHGFKLNQYDTLEQFLEKNS